MSTTIEWTRGDDGRPGKTWNPVRGCSRVSPGCVHCYAERQAARNLPGMRSPSTGEPLAIMTPSGPRWTGKVELIESKLEEPLHWKKPRRVFVNSMSDLFHEGLPDFAIQRVFNTMHNADWHTYQILSKRGQRMNELLTRVPWWGEWPQWRHVWLGVSVEDQRSKDRIDVLRETPAVVRFLSIEPLLEDIGLLDLSGISWVIVGGESGPGARRFDLEWGLNIVDQCARAGVSCFVKQIGSNPYWQGYPMGRASRGDLKGGDMEQWPLSLRIREFPQPARAEAGR